MRFYSSCNCHNPSPQPLTGKRYRSFCVRDSLSRGAGGILTLALILVFEQRQEIGLLSSKADKHRFARFHKERTLE